MKDNIDILAFLLCILLLGFMICYFGTKAEMQSIRLEHEREMSVGNLQERGK